MEEGLVSALWEALGASVLAPLFTVVVLPLLYGLVGFNKREQREKAAQALRLDAELARNLGDLARDATDPSDKARLTKMHAHALSDFMGKAQDHFETQADLAAKPEKQYVILPWPRGLFGWIWSFFAVSWFAFFVMALIAVVLSPPSMDAKTGAEAVGFLIGYAIVLGILLGIAMLFRWFAFMSARFGAPKPRRQRQSQS